MPGRGERWVTHWACAGEGFEFTYHTEVLLPASGSAAVSSGPSKTGAFYGAAV